LSTTVLAQDYKTSIGVKSNYSTLGNLSLQVNAKCFLINNHALDMSLGASRSQVTSQLNYHYNMTIGDGLSWYVGAGMHMGVWAIDKISRKSNYKKGDLWVGLCILGGVEYSFSNFPINLGLEMGPIIQTFPYGNVGWNANFAVRYIINR